MASEAMPNRAVWIVWGVGYVAIVIAKHTIYGDTWGSSDLSLHWHYWAWQVAWTVFVLGGGSVVAKRFRRHQSS